MTLENQTALYDRIGGKEAIQLVVQKLYIRILQDPDLSLFFSPGSTEKLKYSQMAFLSYAFGGPHHYTGKNLREAHAPLLEQGLSDKHFDLVAHYLKSILQDLQIDESLINEVMTIVSSTRADVLNR